MPRLGSFCTHLAVRVVLPMKKSGTGRAAKGKTLTKIVNTIKGVQTRKPKALRVCITLAAMRTTAKFANTRGKKDIAMFPGACKVLNVIHGFIDGAIKKIERMKQHADRLCTDYIQYTGDVEKLKTEHLEATESWVGMICQYKAIPACTSFKHVTKDSKEWRVPLVEGIPSEIASGAPAEGVSVLENTSVYGDRTLFSKGETLLREINTCRAEAAIMKELFLIAKDGIAKTVLAIEALAHTRRLAGDETGSKTAVRVLFDKMGGMIPGILKETEAATREFEAMHRRFDFLTNYTSEMVSNHIANSRLWAGAVCQKFNIPPVARFGADWSGDGSAATGTLVLKTAFTLAPSPVCGFKPPPRDGRTPSQIAISIVADAGRVSRKAKQPK